VYYARRGAGVAFLSCLPGSEGFPAWLWYDVYFLSCLPGSEVICV